MGFIGFFRAFAAVRPQVANRRSRAGGQCCAAAAGASIERSRRFSTPLTQKTGIDASHRFQAACVAALATTPTAPAPASSKAAANARPRPKCW